MQKIKYTFVKNLHEISLNNVNFYTRNQNKSISVEQFFPHITLLTTLFYNLEMFKIIIFLIFDIDIKYYIYNQTKFHSSDRKKKKKVKKKVYVKKSKKKRKEKICLSYEHFYH